MNSSAQNPKLPTWLFIATDLALIGAAALIAFAFQPLTTTTMFIIVGCIAAGAIFGLLPLVARYESQKNEALDERQRALEALARTVSSSAEQISIAAAGLHEMAELAQKNLRQAEQLPHKLQDKIAEFHVQLGAAQDAEKEELERELLSLRTTESERLESVSQRIAKSAAEWGKLEAATQQHLAAAHEALAKLSFGTASAIGKAQAAAEQALTQARIEAARTIGDASGQGTKAIEAAKAAALGVLEAKLAAEFSTRLGTVSRALDEKIARLEAAASHSSSLPTMAAPPAAETAAPDSTAAAAGGSSEPSTSPEAPASSEEPSTQSPPAPAAPPAKRPRKARREESTVALEPAAPAPEAGPSAGVMNTPVDHAPESEPAPIPVAQIAEIAPVAPHTTEPFSAHASNGASAPPEPIPETTPADAAPKPSRKRLPPKNPEANADPEPGLGLELDDATTSAASVAERVMTSDGATRLLVTAYIGIGNRLFIRGEGPGLSWEKGVPLQFVSIGKWRWETSDAGAPVQFKLYKNDAVECAALGAQSLDPGHQQEVTAAF